MNIITKIGGKANYFRNIYLWKKFSKQVRSREQSLLSELNKFDKSILVAGCQRSGTTALSRVITTSDAMVNYWFGSDDELDAALILSGTVQHTPRGRYCFQTTYLNERYPEYLQHKGQYKLIWIVRNPFSVIHSMLNNWSRFALDELFESCGVEQADQKLQHKYHQVSKHGVAPIQRACLAYNGKTSQLFYLLNNLSKNDIMIVDYDLLVEKKAEVLADIYNFVDLDFRLEYSEKISSGSLNKSMSLSHNDRSLVERLCVPVYEQAKKHHYTFVDQQCATTISTVKRDRS